MPTTTDRKTTADLLAMPDDGIERWLIDGQIVEIGPFEGPVPEEPMTIRNRSHTRIEANIVGLLREWAKGRPQPRGSIHSGEVGVRLQTDPEVVVGLDVIYLRPDQAALAEADAESTIVTVIPTLAVEVLSPNDTAGGVSKRVKALHAAGVPLVWYFDPELQTVTVHELGDGTKLFNIAQTLTGDPHLPGFSVPVAAFFGAL